MAGAGEAAAAAKRPNILFVLTDDQDTYLGSDRYMPQVEKLIASADNGASLGGAFVTTPVCCPSRGSYLTGRYIHNIPVRLPRRPRGPPSCDGPSLTARCVCTTHARTHTRTR